MKKILLFSVVLFYSLLSYGQNKNSEATYRFYIHQEENKKYTAEMKQEQSGIENAAKKVTLKLVFNDSLSMYYVDHGIMDPTEFNYYMALSYTRGKIPIYASLKKKITYYNTPQELMYKDNEFLVTDSFPKWKLINETKKINNYICYKATYEKEYPYYKDVVLKTITAWYCPEFPYPYGPKGFNGLPGLIFEVQDDKTVIGIETITLNNNNKEIKLPTKGKVLKEIDYYLKLHNSIAEFMEMNKK